MPRFTAGFETLHSRGLKDKKRRDRPSEMFGPGMKSTLSRSTQKLVEKLAKQSKLNRTQMRALGSLASAGRFVDDFLRPPLCSDWNLTQWCAVTLYRYNCRNALHTAPGRMSYAPSMELLQPKHTLPYQERTQKVHTMRFGCVCFRPSSLVWYVSCRLRFFVFIHLFAIRRHRPTIKLKDSIDKQVDALCSCWL